jgi:hypothetical protein
LLELNWCVKEKIDPARDQVLQLRGKAAIRDNGELGPGFFLKSRYQHADTDRDDAR